MSATDPFDWERRARRALFEGREATASARVYFDSTRIQPEAARALAAVLPTVSGEDLQRNAVGTEADDLGVNFRVNDSRLGSLVFKRHRPERVPDPFHEVIVSRRVNALGITTLEYLAVTTAPDGTSWMITRFLPDHVDLAAARRSADRPQHHLFDVGALARRLIAGGLAVGDLDLKNVLVHSSGVGTLVLHDFERTPDATFQAAEIVRKLTPAFLRRIRRAGLRDDELAELFAGFCATPLHLDREALLSFISNVPRQSRSLVVSIDGLAASGKSTLGQQFADGIPGSVVVETDWFVRFDRRVRSQSNFDVTHPEWYNYSAALECVAALRAGGEFHASGLYSHETGRRDLTLTIGPADVVLVEGMYASLIADADVRVFMSVSLATSLQRFIARDWQRGVLDSEVSLERARKINGAATRAAILDNQNQADIVLRSGPGSSYELREVSSRFRGDILTAVRDFDMDSASAGCPFCSFEGEKSRYTLSGRNQALYNVAPIVRGHVLIAPLRHIKSLTQLDDSERREFFDFAYETTLRILHRTKAADFDWALQDGQAAGQTVEHLHLHVLPRHDPADVRRNSWFTAVYGTTAEAPESPDRRRLTAEELRGEIRWLLGED